ncbi:tetratricopeptide repeat protein [Amycolatopsis nalaikhensis]|uniref:Nephrocystin 3-like N-terminal domain-containing protein n=1 Tax=Amycolatopsis nalaikhensis TaxID=715472 RepID=A0ABY8XTZ0_9PSEU|nr:hypothetical protein [Amycolatopsis sp. 2-2]WIV59160.1 hypothetical protein QP939_11280 [Amycolatopsis sp. 2-2]
MTASKTGSATAAGSGLANSGIINGDVTMVPVVTTHYRESVLRIAPPTLVDRADELQALADFCTEPDVAEPYMWWCAGAWSGKSALMSWFVLHPPPGVRVVSFFITARLASQDDRAAFCDNVIEQLAALLEEPLPPLLTESTRDAHLLGMLAEAADLCAERGERLVLLVDGLDEDRAANSGPDAHSIAALLPYRPPAGVRVIVSSRPHPTIPGDVPDDHPLRDPAVVRPLAASPAAKVVQDAMERELDRLLGGPGRDLVGLVVAARDGLTGADFAELMGWSRRRVERLLTTVAGRSFVRRAGGWPIGAESELYVLGHEKLHDTAIEDFTEDQLIEYRQRLHEWAARYRERDWPADTPEYLLRGYAHMLITTGDVSRALACTTDRVRHDRMRAVSGGDTAALNEITSLQDLLLRADRPDLAALASTAVHRGELSERNTDTSPGLPAVWAALGHLPRAEALLGAIPDPARAALATIAVSRALSTVGDLDTARTFAHRADDIVRANSDNPYVEASTAFPLASAMLDVGEIERCDQLVERGKSLTKKFTLRNEPFDSLTELTQAIAAAGPARAQVLIDQAQQILPTIDSHYFRSVGMVDLALAAAKAGDPDHADILVQAIPMPQFQIEAVIGLITIAEGDRVGRLAGQAEAMLWALPDPIEDGGIQLFPVPTIGSLTARLAETLLGIGRLDQASALTERIEDAGHQARVFCLLAMAEIAAGNSGRARELGDRAETVTRGLANRRSTVDKATALANALTDAGDRNRATNVLDQASRLALGLADAQTRRSAIRNVVKALLHVGDLDRAEALIRSCPDFNYDDLVGAGLDEVAVHDPARATALIEKIGSPTLRAQVMLFSAQRIAENGNLVLAGKLLDRTEEIVATITGTADRVGPVTWMITAAMTIGDRTRADTLVAQAEQMVAAEPEPEVQERAVVALVGEFARHGYRDRAESLARIATTAHNVADTAISLAAAAASDAAEPQRARELASRAEALTLELDDLERRGLLTARLTDVLAGIGDVDRAGELVRTIADPVDRVRAAVVLIRAIAQSGDADKARTLAVETEAFIAAIPDVSARTRATTHFVQTVTIDGSRGRAEEFATTIALPAQRAALLAVLALQAEQKRAERLIARILRFDDWTAALTPLVRAKPDVLTYFADELPLHG